MANRKVYSTFNEFFKHTNILQVCIYNLINLWRKQWLSMEMRLGDKMLTGPKVFTFYFIYMLYKILNASRVDFFPLLCPYPSCRVTESSNGISLGGFFFWLVLLETAHVIEILHIIFKDTFYKTFKKLSRN